MSAEVSLKLGGNTDLNVRPELINSTWGFFYLKSNLLTLNRNEV
jgi:hypothetical protein